MHIGRIVCPDPAQQGNVARYCIECGLHERRRIEHFLIPVNQHIGEAYRILHEAEAGGSDDAGDIAGIDIFKGSHSAGRRQPEKRAHPSPEIGVRYEGLDIDRLRRSGEAAGRYRARALGNIFQYIVFQHHTFENINETQLPPKPNADEMTLTGAISGSPL